REGTTFPRYRRKDIHTLSRRVHRCAKHTCAHRFVSLKKNYSGRSRVDRLASTAKRKRDVRTALEWHIGATELAATRCGRAFDRSTLRRGHPREVGVGT